MSIVIYSILPNYGPIAGGTPIAVNCSITSALTDSYTVTIGGVPCTSVVVISSGLITAITAAASEVGPSDVVISDTTTPFSATFTKGFAYLEPGVICLQQLIDASKQRANMENMQLVSDIEWTSYINQSAYELYDLLITTYGNDYYCAPALQFSTNGNGQLYPLPNGVNYSAAPSFYKLLGVDLQLGNAQDSWVTLKPFKFSDRNRYAVPNFQSFYGITNLRYRLNGNNILFTPIPAAGQGIQLWYIPRLTELVNPTDVLDGVSGWSEYIIVDAAIKALIKEESDVSALALDKADLMKRINATAENRDAGFPQRVGDTSYLDFGEPTGSGSGFGFGDGAY